MKVRWFDSVTILKELVCKQICGLHDFCLICALYSLQTPHLDGLGKEERSGNMQHGLASLKYSEPSWAWNHKKIKPSPSQQNLKIIETSKAGSTKKVELLSQAKSK